MFATRTVTADLVHFADVPACLSTAGPEGSRYVAANAGYLKLIERLWPEIQHKELLAAGSALGSAERDRRLWMLETNGSYDSEPAEVRAATGRIIPVEISSQRVWCSGMACDLEYFMPVPPARPRDAGCGSGGTTVRRASFTPRFGASLRSMDLLERRILIGRILSLAARAAVLAKHLDGALDTGPALTAIWACLGPYQVIDPASPIGIGFDFADLDYQQLENLLLQVAGEIWFLIMASEDRQITETLRCLIKQYTMPRPVLVNG